MKINNTEIFDQVIIDMIITALEGGSNYWYWLPDLSMIKRRQNIAISEDIGFRCINGEAVVPVHDDENREEFLGNISKENIERGVRLYMEDGYDVSIDADWDANDADVLLQYIVMGKLVYV